VLGWWIPLLGDAFVCFATLALDSVHCVGAVTVTTVEVPFENDPFARLFHASVFESDLFCAVAPPPGPVVERYAGVAWPGGRF